VRDGALIIAYDGALVTAEDCAERGCFIHHPAWSPDGTRLLYYVGSYDGSVPHQLRVVRPGSEAQTLAIGTAPFLPAAWSPAGDTLAYLSSTDRQAEATAGPTRLVLELYTVPVAADGAVGDPTLHGEVLFGQGCGGGGRSESALAYEREGGFAYGYLAATVLWTPADLLLYTTGCNGAGVGRFDLATNTLLEPLDGNPRSLALNATGDRFVAIDDQSRLVVGSPDGTAITALETPVPPEMVFFGPSGLIYFTTVEYTGSRDVMDAAAGWDQAIQLQPFLDTTEAALYALEPDGTVQELYAGDGYAYANVSELADGGVRFARVEDNAELAAAIESGALTADNWRDYLPAVDVLWLAPGATTPELWIDDAAQYVTPAQ
jgi:hypothetical protein